MKTDVVTQVQHRFTITDDDGTQFTDALYFNEGEVPDDATLDAMRQARYANWKAVVSAPPVPMTDVQKAQQVEFLLTEQTRIADELAATDPVILADAQVALGIAVAPVPALLDGTALRVA